MNRKIIHFSDLHWRMFKHHDTWKKVLIEAFNQWSEIKPYRIIFTGDLVHSKNQLTPELIDMVSWTLTECAKIAPTILIIGNHDFLEKNEDRLDALSPIINNLNNPNITYYKNTGVHEDKDIVWCVYSLMEHNIKPEFIREEGKKYIGLFHGPINGLTTDLGFAFEDGYSPQIFDGLDTVLCGDIHKRSIFNIPGNKKGIMIGSALQNNFGESVGNHGYGIYNVDTDKYEFIDIENDQPFLHFKITDIEDIENEKEQLVNA